MSDQKVWSQDKCTCGHVQSDHRDTPQGFGTGDCLNCENERAYGAHERSCGRYQWDGEPRRRVW